MLDTKKYEISLMKIKTNVMYRLTHVMHDRMWCNAMQHLMMEDKIKEQAFKPSKSAGITEMIR